MKPYNDVSGEKDLLQFALEAVQERPRDITEFDALASNVDLFYKSFESITATADIGNFVTTFIDCTSGNVTGTLPDASLVAGQIFIVKRTDSSGNSVTIDTNAGNIDNSANKSLAALGQIIAQSDGSNYYIIG